MSKQLEDDLRKWAAPVLDGLDLAIYDVEITSGRVRLTVDKVGGVGLDEIAKCTRALSPILDEHDPIGGKYTLEVSSPGIERKLRTIPHRHGAVGETVKCKYRSIDGQSIRVEGTLTNVDDDQMTIAAETGDVNIDHVDILSLHTVFVWPQAKQTQAGNRSNGSQKARKATP